MSADTPAWTFTSDELARAGDIAAVIDVTAAAAEPAAIADGRALVLTTPPGSTSNVIDLEKYAERPLRRRGKVKLLTTDSFARYVGAYVEPGTTVYADPIEFRFVGVLDGNASNDHDGDPGWSEHTVTTTLRKTQAWQRWETVDRKLLPQGEFAQLIEDSVPELVEPDAATMLEIAQTFHARNGLTFRSAAALASGERQFEYSEAIEATAGRSGTLSIPEKIRLAIRPFEGSELFEITARFRYRLDSGQLQLGYVLDRPEDILRAAFDDAYQEITETNSNVPSYLGTPPA